MSSSAAARGRLFVVSAPSGTGKTTVVERLVRLVPNLRMSRSYTSRPAREGEADGLDYSFVSRARFEAMIAGDQFLEFAEVFGNFYGTSQLDTEKALAAGDDLVLVIDVQGARKVRRRGVPVVSVFVLPPSFDVLESRLRGRSKDSDEQIRRRLDVAREEISAVSEYDYVVVNDDVDTCVEQVKAVVLAERAKLTAMHPQITGIVESFGVRPQRA
jgi:guanylate kinase